MTVPLLSLKGTYAITILFEGHVEHRACQGFRLLERDYNRPEERYHLEWFDLVRNKPEAFMACSYTRSADGRKYTIVNEFHYQFIFESKMFAT